MLSNYHIAVPGIHPVHVDLNIVCAFLPTVGNLFNRISLPMIVSSDTQRFYRDVIYHVSSAYAPAH